jgi:hypothetical protein
MHLLKVKEKKTLSYIYSLFVFHQAGWTDEEKSGKESDEPKQLQVPTNPTRLFSYFSYFPLYIVLFWAPSFIFVSGSQ